MRALITILGLLVLSSAAIADGYFGKQSTAGVSSGTSDDIWGEQSPTMWYTADAGDALDSVCLWTKNYFNDTSSIRIGLYLVDTGTGYITDSVATLLVEMSAEEQTGSDQLLKRAWAVPMTEGLTYAFVSGDNTNGFRRLYSGVADTTGGAADTVGTDHDIFDANTVVRPNDPETFPATMTQGSYLNYHPVIYGHVTNTPPEPSGNSQIIIVE